ncbi:ATP-binding protein [Pseudoflavonifractor phocaeensis]|uniref:ATP-binding protein n=1 Tax=Pseudoflavonifractor phocaeensis TaxID=1870988 RepID=UPI00195D0592|nr:HAMP domain-containing histidine kinase [Pseudoflavonifractor phocaeensis]
MRNVTIKVRITVWYLLLMTMMAGLLLAFLLLISGTVTTQTAMEQLSQAVRANLHQVEMVDGSLQLGEDFSFYEDGVYSLIYSQSEALLAGQVPVNFSTEEPFENGLTRVVEVAGDLYYVLDFWIPMGWENGVWIRGILEVPRSSAALTNLLRAAMITLPIFILLAAVGGYLIARRAFRPLEQITSTAAAISEASDLSARVEIPPGKNEFVRLAQTFNQMFERLERSFEAETQFTADASHELRTPVSVIKSACEYAEKYEETPEEHLETISMIHRQADKMSRLIGQLLSITRLDQGTDMACQEKVDLSALVEELCAEQTYPKDRLLCRCEPGILARVDTALITRLTQNLIDNGFKYGKPDGHVWVELRRTAEEIQLSVKDDGIGIDREQQEKVWQRFYQVDPSRSERGGAGLGLSMVRKIAQAHGGTMTLESISGLGSTFTLHLPLEGMELKEKI